MLGPIKSSLGLNGSEWRTEVPLRLTTGLLFTEFTVLCHSNMQIGIMYMSATKAD